MQLFELMLDFETLLIRNIISRENFEIEQRSLKVRSFCCPSAPPQS
jgi:hypothetical protein